MGAMEKRPLPRASSEPKKKPEKRGPKADVLKIEGDWQEAIRKSLQKKKPSTGWPN
jgi:hypothetical protein